LRRRLNYREGRGCVRRESRRKRGGDGGKACKDGAGVLASWFGRRGCSNGGIQHHKFAQCIDCFHQHLIRQDPVTDSDVEQGACKEELVVQEAIEVRLPDVAVEGIVPTCNVLATWHCSELICLPLHLHFCGNQPWHDERACGCLLSTHEIDE